MAPARFNFRTQFPNQRRATILSDTNSGNRSTILLSIAFFFSYFGVGAIQQFLGPYLELKTGLPPATCAWVLGSVYLAGIPMRLVSAWMVNQIGTRATVTLGLAFCTSFSWLIVATVDFDLLIVGAVIWGWGAACLWVGGLPIVLNAVKEGKYGASVSVLYSAVYLGQGGGVCFLGWIAPEPGDPKLFLAAAIISLAANVVIVFLPSQGRIEKVDRPSIFEGLRALASGRGAIISFILLTTTFGFGILLGNLSGSVSAEGSGRIAVVTVGFHVARLICSMSAGPLSDRFGRAPLLFFAFTLSSAMLIATGISEHHLVRALAALSLGVQMGVGSVIVTALIGDFVPPNKRHVVLGSLFVWHGIGAASSIIMGQKLRQLLEGYQPTFIIFGVVMGICAILSIVLGLLPKPEADEQQAGADA